MNPALVRSLARSILEQSREIELLMERAGARELSYRDADEKRRDVEEEIVNLAVDLANEVLDA